MQKLLKSMSLGVLSVVAAVGMGTNVLAQTGGGSTLNATLTPLNGSGASGTSTIEMLDDNKVRVTVDVQGTSPSLAHAQHLHIGGNNVCPDPSADTDGDGYITTAEGQPSYGEVKVSLTTKDAVDSGSALAVERMSKASADGVVTYERTFTLPKGVSQDDLRNAVVVHHGISELFNDKKAYDGDKKSSLDEKLPLEATIPAACGSFASQPTGAVSTGFGANDTTTNAAVIAAGVLSLGAAGVLVARRHFES